MKRVNYLGGQSVHLPRKGCRYKMKLLVDKSGGLGGVKKKGLARSSLEEVNQARKVAGLAPLEEGMGLRREVGLKPLTEGGESLREALKKGNFKPESSQIFELMEKIHSGGRHALSSNKWSRISPSYKGPSLDMVDSDEANNNTVVDGKEELEQVNYLGQLDTTVMAWELVYNILEEAVGGGHCDVAIGGQ